MKKVFLTFVLAGANFSVVADIVQTKSSPDKAPYLYTESYKEGDGGSSVGVLAGGQIFHFDGNNWCAYNSTNGGVGFGWRHPHYDNYDGHGGWWDTTEADLMTSPVSGMGTDLYSGSHSQYVDGSSSSYTGSSLSGWLPPVVWEHCGVTLVASYYTDYPHQWVGSDFPSSPLNVGIYHRAADAVVKLKTGGKEESMRRTLFQLTAVAAEVTDKFSYSYGWENGYGGYDIYGPQGSVPIPAESVTVMGKPLGSDSNLWVALPDNADIDVTPRVQNKEFYTFNVQQQKYELNIVVNETTTLKDDQIVSGAYYCVGQHLNFEAVFSTDVPGLSHISPIWNYTANYINNHWIDVNGCEEYNIAPIPSMSNPTVAWFYNHKTQDVDAYVGLFCRFANGQTAYITDKGLFNVFAPTVTVSDIRERYFRLSYADFLLGLGDSDNTGAMVYQVNYKSILPFSGTGRITQLCQLNDSGIHYPSCSFSDYRLDGGEAYEEDAIVPNTAHVSLTLQDGPYNVDTFTNRLQGSFEDYIRFRPDAGNASDNIFVTLGIVSWNVLATATSSGINTAQSPDPTGPSNSNEFPIWTNTH
jgi:hypothetical protein